MIGNKVSVCTGSHITIVKVTVTHDLVILFILRGGICRTLFAELLIKIDSED